MTLLEIQTQVARVKKISRRQVQRHMQALKIKPLGVQRPRVYPQDTAARIVLRLGVEGKGLTAIPSLNALRAERRKAQTATVTRRKAA